MVSSFLWGVYIVTLLLISRSGWKVRPTPPPPPPPGNVKPYTQRLCSVISEDCQWKTPLTLKRLGGGGGAGPPRHFARLLCNAQSSRRDTLWLFSFKFPAHFDTKFVTPGGTVLKLRNFLYMHVGPKMAPKCDFVYKINANWVFSHSSYKYAYFYSQWLKLICFSIIVLQKVSATNFTEKNNKNKR